MYKKIRVLMANIAEPVFITIILTVFIVLWISIMLDSGKAFANERRAPEIQERISVEVPPADLKPLYVVSPDILWVHAYELRLLPSGDAMIKCAVFEKGQLISMVCSQKKLGREYECSCPDINK